MSRRRHKRQVWLGLLKLVVLVVLLRAHYILWTWIWELVLPEF